MELIQKHVAVRPALVEITYLKALLYYRTNLSTYVRISMVHLLWNDERTLK